MEQAVVKEPKGKLVVASLNFDLLETKIDGESRSTSRRISRASQEDVGIYQVCSILLSVKESHMHGWFGDWLKARFY
jgi:hypothetical protein